MTPPARAQAAIELLDEVIRSAREGGAAADVLVQRYFKARRYAGAKDRRAVRELVYAAIRRAGEVPESGRAALLGLAGDHAAIAALFDGSPHAPAPILPGEPVAAPGIAPRWLEERLRNAIGPDALPALIGRAPLDLRVNRLKATREQVMHDLPEAVPTRHALDGLRLPESTRVETLPGFEDGRFEVQDEGSQLVASVGEAKPGMTVIDLCAGAGGKTLALAAAMAGRGRIVACDVDRMRLRNLAPRAERAGAAAMIEPRLLDRPREAERLADLRGAADLVLIDAPCSGTGTWRRNPEARWRLTTARLARLTDEQRRLIEFAAPLVRPGGSLVYIVCSLLDEEGADQVKHLAGDWEMRTPALPIGRPTGHGWRLDPAHGGTDGFFVAWALRPC